MLAFDGAADPSRHTSEPLQQAWKGIIQAEFPQHSFKRHARTPWASVSRRTDNTKNRYQPPQPPQKFPTTHQPHPSITPPPLPTLRETNQYSNSERGPPKCDHGRGKILAASFTNENFNSPHVVICNAESFRIQRS